MQYEAIDLRTSHGAANNVPCFLLAANVLIATEPHVLRAPEEREQLVPAGTPYLARRRRHHRGMRHEPIEAGLFALLVQQYPPYPPHLGTIDRAFFDRTAAAADFMHECGLLDSKDHVTILGCLTLAGKTRSTDKVRAAFNVVPERFSPCSARVAHCAVVYREFIARLQAFLGTIKAAKQRTLRDGFTAHTHQLGMICVSPFRDIANEARAKLALLADAEDEDAAQCLGAEIGTLLERMRMAFEVEVKLHLRVSDILRAKGEMRSRLLARHDLSAQLGELRDVIAAAELLDRDMRDHALEHLAACDFEREGGLVAANGELNCLLQLLLAIPPAASA